MSAAHQIPYELINQILIMRPTHPVAKLFNNATSQAYSGWDQERKLFYLIDHKFVICMKGNNREVMEGEARTLDPDAKHELPYAKSGMEEVDIITTTWYLRCRNSLKHVALILPTRPVEIV